MNQRLSAAHRLREKVVARLEKAKAAVEKATTPLSRDLRDCRLEELEDRLAHAVGQEVERAALAGAPVPPLPAAVTPRAQKTVEAAAEKALRSGQRQRAWKEERAAARRLAAERKAAEREANRAATRAAKVVEATVKAMPPTEKPSIQHLTALREYRLGQTVYVSKDNKRYVIIDLREQSPHGSRIILHPLSGDGRPEAISVGQYSPGFVKILNFPTPIYYGAQAKKQYESTLAAISKLRALYEKTGQKYGFVMPPFQSAPTKPGEPLDSTPDIGKAQSSVVLPEAADVRVTHRPETGTVAEWDYDADKKRPKEQSIYSAVRRVGFVWAPSADAWRRTNSVGLAETRLPVQALADHLRKLGFTVHFDLQESSLAEAQKARVEHLTARAERMGERAEKNAAAALGALGMAVKKQERELETSGIEGFYPTPPEIAALVLEEAELDGYDGVVLEPEAGRGDLADAIKRAGKTVDVVELNPKLREILRGKGYKVAANDLFATIEPGSRYGRIVMNPPFGARGADAVKHVTRAFELLAPGGLLVAVVPEIAETKLRKTPVGNWITRSSRLPAARFGAANVTTQVIVLRKPRSAEPPPNADEILPMPPRNYEPPEAEATGKLPLLLSGANLPLSTEQRQTLSNRLRNIGREKGTSQLTKGELAELKQLNALLAASDLAEKAKRVAKRNTTLVRDVPQDAKPITKPRRARGNADEVISAMKRLGKKQNPPANLKSSRGKYILNAWGDVRLTVEASDSSWTLSGNAINVPSWTKQHVITLPRETPVEEVARQGMAILFPVRTIESAPEISEPVPDLRERIADMAKLSRDGRVELVTLRQSLSPNRWEATKKGVLELLDEGVLELVKEDNNPAITDEVEGAAIFVAGHPRHIIYWRGKPPPSPEPVRPIGRADYEQRKEAKVERLEAAADRAEKDAKAKWESSGQIAQRFDGGQPILVGHHSEKKARKDQERIHNLMGAAVKAQEKAQRLRRLAGAVEAKDVISADDPLATQKLEAMIAEFELGIEISEIARAAVKAALKDRAKAAAPTNEELQKRKEVVKESGALELMTGLSPKTKSAIGWAMASSDLSSLRAEKKRLEDRLAKLKPLEKVKELEPFRVGDFTIGEEDNRIWIEGPIHSKTLFAKLAEQLGARFHWSPQFKRFQAKITGVDRRKDLISTTTELARRFTLLEQPPPKDDAALEQIVLHVFRRLDKSGDNQVPLSELRKELALDSNRWDRHMFDTVIKRMRGKTLSLSVHEGRFTQPTEEMRAGAIREETRPGDWSELIYASLR